MLTVPAAITPAIAEFCRTISTERPLYVQSKPSPDAKSSACFDNVARKIESEGGEPAYGWAIWHLPGLCFEAEHHGVWRKGSGKLVDVSPQLRRGPKILFLPDPEAIYDPKRFRLNVIKPAAPGVLAAEVTTLALARNEIVNRYRSAGYTTIPADAELLVINDRLRLLLTIAGIAV